jgi:CarboxypepD_reg-like domain/TonB-dependent Receptor Plug Domain
MRFTILLFCLFVSFFCFSQNILQGIVKDKKGEGVFAVNIYLKSTPQKGTTTDFDGNFELNTEDFNDILIVSFLGYKTREILLSSIDFNKKLIVVLKENSQTLEAIIIEARDPISEQFSVVKIRKLDVYLNPVSQGDPLKAITSLPASTTTNETANVSLRGSSADRSRVILNGVPIYKPVRASNLNNQGFFSLFNPEIIDNLYVYASNPPLTYGNTSAGLVEIQTIKNLESDQLQLSTSLASTGVFLSQKIKKEVSFIQVYGNYQFSDAFIGIQEKQYPNVSNFKTKDAGINFHTKIGKKIELNSYNYFIDENFNGFDEQFTYRGEVTTKNKRFFTVNNLKYYTNSGVLSFNNSINTSKQNFNFGNIISENKTDQTFNSLSYKWFFKENLDFQFGISHDYQQFTFNDSTPTFFYALSPDSPSSNSETAISNTILETYLYGKWDINDKFILSTGLRSNIPLESQEYYLSSQLSLKYNLNKRQSFLLSGGKYYNYSTPNFFSKEFNLQSSNQIALDYSYRLKNTLLTAAAYFKNETSEQAINSFFVVDKVNTFGVELFFEQNFYKYFKFTLANSFINQTVTIDNEEYKGQNDFDYLLKTTLQYNNPKIFSLALTYIARPGTYYNPVIGSSFDNNTGFYEPIFGNDLFSLQYNNYNRLDLSISKYIKFRKSALIPFTSLNNILNQKNESQILYDADYLSNRFNYFQFRTIYFGITWQLDY